MIKKQRATIHQRGSHRAFNFESIFVVLQGNFLRSRFQDVTVKMIGTLTLAATSAGAAKQDVWDTLWTDVTRLRFVNL